MPCAAALSAPRTTTPKTGVVEDGVWVHGVRTDACRTSLQCRGPSSVGSCRPSSRIRTESAPGRRRSCSPRRRGTRPCPVREVVGITSRVSRKADVRFTSRAPAPVVQRQLFEVTRHGPIPQLITAPSEAAKSANGYPYGFLHHRFVRLIPDDRHRVGATDAPGLGDHCIKSFTDQGPLSLGWRLARKGANDRSDRCLMQPPVTTKDATAQVGPARSSPCASPAPAGSSPSRILPSSSRVRQNRTRRVPCAANRVGVKRHRRPAPSIHRVPRPRRAPRHPGLAHPFGSGHALWAPRASPVLCRLKYAT